MESVLITRCLGALFTFVAVLSWPPEARAQQPPRDPLVSEIEELKKSLAEQQKRLEELERRLSATSAVETPVTPDPPPAAASGLAKASAAQEGWKDDPVDVSGYYNFRFLKNGTTKAPSTFQAHVVSIFITKTLGKWQVFSELQYQYSPRLASDGTSLTSQRGEIDLETAWINYNHRDWLNMRAGSLAVPTYWRVHRYPSTTLTVTEPLTDRRIFPSTIIGVMTHGSKYAGSQSRLDYTFYLGNGRGTNPGRQDWNGHKAYGGTLVGELPTKGIFDLFEIGVQFYRDKPPDGNKENIYGFQSRLNRGRASFLGEFAHGDLIGPGGRRTYFREGYYLQPSWQLSPRWHTVYRYDRLNRDSRIATDRDEHRHVTGLVFRPRPTIAIKLELARYYPEGTSIKPYNAAAGAIAFFFQ